MFQKYREAYHSGTFDKNFFDNIYVPQFIKELSEKKAALDMLGELKKKALPMIIIYATIVKMRLCATAALLREYFSLWELKSKQKSNI